MRGPRQFFFLIVVCGLGLIAAVLESGGRPTSSGGLDAESVQQIYTLAYGDVLQQLYPDDPQSHYMRGARALFERNDAATARKHFETALAMGVKTDENLLYYYAVSLIRTDADQAKVDEAIANWRRNFPHSGHPHPRDFAQRGLRKEQSLESAQPSDETRDAGPVGLGVNRPSPKVGDPR